MARWDLGASQCHPCLVVVDELDKIVLAYWKKIHFPPVRSVFASAPVSGAYVDCLPVDANTMLLFLLWQGRASGLAGRVGEYD